MAKERVIYLDQMKGVAIFFMVMGHIMLFAFKAPNSMIEAFGVSNMPIFFFVSGFLAYHEMTDRKSFVKSMAKRLRRLVIPWLIVTIAMCLYSDRAFEPTLLSFYWFFYMLVLLSVVFHAYEYIVARRLQKVQYYVSSYVLLMALVALGYYSGFQSYEFPFAEFVVFATSYLLGWCSKKYTAFNNFCLNNHLLFIVCIPLFIYGCCNISNLNIMTRILAGNAGVLIWQSFFYHLGNTANNQRFISLGWSRSAGKLIAYLGQCSLSIYLLNNFLIPDLTGLGATFLNLGNGFLWQFVIVAILTVPVIGACVLIKEMTKHNKYLTQILS